MEYRRPVDIDVSDDSTWAISSGVSSQGSKESRIWCCCSPSLPRLQIPHFLFPLPLLRWHTCFPPSPSPSAASPRALYPSSQFWRCFLLSFPHTSPSLRRTLFDFPLLSLYFHFLIHVVHTQTDTCMLCWSFFLPSSRLLLAVFTTISFGRRISLFALYLISSRVQNFVPLVWVCYLIFTLNLVFWIPPFYLLHHHHGSLLIFCFRYSEDDIFVFHLFSVHFFMRSPLLLCLLRHRVCVTLYRLVSAIPILRSRPFRQRSFRLRGRRRRDVEKSRDSSEKRPVCSAFREERDASLRRACVAVRVACASGAVFVEETQK